MTLLNPRSLVLSMSLGIYLPQSSLAPLQSGIPDTSHLPFVLLIKINYTVLLSGSSSDLEDPSGQASYCLVCHHLSNTSQSPELEQALLGHCEVKTVCTP